MTKAKIVAVTNPKIPNCNTAEDFISYCARVSNPKNQENFDTAPKLLQYCIKEKHWSIFEMVNIVMEIQTTRDISRQIIRHKSFSYQEFCVSGDTLIKTGTKGGRTKKVKIEDLYKRQESSQYSKMSNWLVKIYDQNSNTFKFAKIKEVFDTGKKEVFKIVLDNGKTIKTTKDHKLFTFDGFKKVEDITCEDFVGCNGQPIYQDYNWLSARKNESIENGLGLQYIADVAGVKYSTIKKWLKKNNLQYTMKEVASYTQVWNKRLPKEKQPNYGKYHSLETREKMRKSAKTGRNSNLYKNGKYTVEERSWRWKVASFCGGYKSQLLIEQNYICPISGKKLTKDNSEVDHIQPVFLRPDLAFDKNNLQVIFKEEHKRKSQRESILSKQTVKFSKVKSIEYVGVEQTYDLEVDHDDHNYIANDIVTHNSQRYAETPLDNWQLRECREQHPYNRQKSVLSLDQHLTSEWYYIQERIMAITSKLYHEALKKGVAKEQARAILPEGLTPTTIYMNGNLRSWLHYCDLRRGHGTQQEHIEVAEKAWEELKTEFKFLEEL